MSERKRGRGREIDMGRGRGTLLTAASVVLVAVLMAGSSAGSSIGAAPTISAPFKGLVTPENSISTSGCRAKATLRSFKFDLHTGAASGASVGKVGSCGKGVPKGYGFSSDVSVDGGYAPVFVKLPKIASTVTNVSASLGGKWTISMSGTDGGSFACRAPSSTSYFLYTIWQWNWTGSYFAGFAENYSDYYDGVWTNSTANLASIPSPFNLNNTTYYFHEADSFTYSACQSGGYFDYDLYGDLYDAATGATYPSTGSDLPEDGYSAVYVQNITDWGWTNYSEWYGPTNYSFSYPTTTSSYNVTGSEVYQYAYSPSSGFLLSLSTGMNNTQAWSNTTKLAGGSMWWAMTFSPSDPYYLELNLYLNAAIFNDNWVRGGASYDLNMATAGNGVKLSSISLT